MLNLKDCRIDPRVVAFLEQVRAWATMQPDVSAIALVGSHAHGRARPDSDIDLVILSDDPDPRRDSGWLDVFGPLSSVTTENWGVLTAHRVMYIREGEVEVGVAHSSWADIPVDAGTFRVVSDGIVPVYDPRNLLRNLVAEVRQQKA